MSQSTVTTLGVGRSRIEPETVDVKVEATGAGEDPAAARQRANERADAVTADLAGLDAEARVLDFNLVDTTGPFGEEDTPPFRATKQLGIRASPDDVDAVIDRASTAGGTVEETVFGLSEETRAEHRTSALQEAVAMARREAAAIADAEGRSLGEAEEIAAVNADSTTRFPVEHDIVEDALDHMGTVEFDAGAVVLMMEVEATYRLEPA